MKTLTRTVIATAVLLASITPYTSANAGEIKIKGGGLILLCDGTPYDPVTDDDDILAGTKCIDLTTVPQQPIPQQPQPATPARNRTPVNTPIAITD